MFIQINFQSGLPAYLQVVDQVKAATATGRLKTGDALPTIRALAEQLRINRNTVAKAYTELENQGIIENLVGKGCFVAGNHSPYTQELRRKMMTEAVDAVLVQAHHLQVRKEDLIELIQERLEVLNGKLAQTAYANGRK